MSATKRKEQMEHSFRTGLLEAGNECLVTLLMSMDKGHPDYDEVVDLYAKTYKLLKQWNLKRLDDQSDQS